jgi:hypothetical protein
MGRIGRAEVALRRGDPNLAEQTLDARRKSSPISTIPSTRRMPTVS